MMSSPLVRYGRSFVTIAMMLALTAYSISGAVAQQALGTGMVALNDAQLAHIRGGFDFPNLTVTFGFQEVTSVNNQVVNNVIVPNMTFSTASANASSETTSNSLLPFSKLGATQPLVFNSLTRTQGQNVTVQFGANGLITTIQNNLNNQLIQNKNTVNLSVSGLTPLLAQGTNNSVLSNALAAAHSFSH
jgi:hypothetical protein